jgi:CRISPR type I-E-associated protein CasB/Cse2
MTDTTASSKTPFVRHLNALYKQADRGAFAELRRAAYDPLNDPRVFMVVGDALPNETQDTDAHLVTACLFALYVQPFMGRQEGSKEPRPDLKQLYNREPGGRKWRSFGASMRLLREKLEREGAAGVESLERRFTALLDSPFDDLPVRLRRLVQRLRSAEIPVDFTALLQDLQTWQRQERGWTPASRVQRRWATDYWQPPVREEGDATDDAAS